ncbi:hypothetical protein QF035_000223 [Streptomyces umbrinus]|uniref:Uncharacterized protein n=1 Tax=Streptomyces umbrinus TaxID=67370 RepID=A0ABU0SGG4_9ACTN|nr:hypothetical protein [Streptomyces umbrinus]MDQ1022641.1 hypothetical protein [Streptomyces umbrinus]
MLTSVRHLDQLAREWNINPEDVLLIALNASGARSPLDKPRMHFQLRLDSRPDTPLYLILSLGRHDSPFELDEHELRLGGEKVGEVDGCECVIAAVCGPARSAVTCSNRPRETANASSAAANAPPAVTAALTGHPRRPA